MAGPVHTTPSNPEYQHFVPQFILRNFAHKYTGPQRSKKGKNKKKDDSIFRGEFVVNNVNLKADPIAIEETKVKRILGQYDMYQDTALPAAQRRQIETMLGKLEAHVSTIFRKMTKAFDAGDPSVWVTREERNAIRKFLFILKYRGSTFHNRFYHENPDQYDANDKSRLQTYMEKNSLKRPVDVWFHNLKTIMNLNMNTEGWQRELVEQMYSDDAMWFIMHSEMMYMAICTPSETDAEFILTDNSYNVFEGPNTFVQNPATGEFSDNGWTSFHEFAPLSPKLMIILRSFLFPVPEEDSDPEIKAWRDARRKEAVDDWYGTSQQSSLADLPIKKARNSYSEVVNGRVRLLPGEDGVKRKTDKFCFQFFPVGMEHVNKINHILFDNAYRCTNIVFNSKDTFFKTLEWYMTYSSTLGKLITGDSEKERRKHLQNLAALMKSLGSTREPVWTESPGHAMSEFEQLGALFRSLQAGLMDWMLSAKQELQTSPTPPRGSKFAYICLGGSDESFLEDMDHAAFMLKQRIKIDVRSRGMPEMIREQDRQELIKEYLTYPSRRVLFYVKRVRLMILEHHDEGYLQRAIDSALEDPEDIIAHALHDKMAPNKLNRLIYNTAMNDIDREKNPISEQELWKTPPQSLEGALRLGMIGKYVFAIPGLLKDCGIPEVERLAPIQEQIIRRQDLSRIKGLPFHFITNDQKTELLTRLMVKPMFRQALDNSVEADLLSRLENVLFKISYPTPPMKPPI
ncbi:hypothetical protein ANO14919_105750 [Xylariales sp. No.14919]|nr:hypothetical protein ANO14919_105750 [Xylariales sp. No.14919]